MARSGSLNQVEQLVLLALARLDDEGYGVTIRREIRDRAGKSVSTTAVYSALERLERQGFVQPWMSEPLPERGGRARKHYHLTPAGAEVLELERAAIERMWEGLELGAHPSKSGAPR